MLTYSHALILGIVEGLTEFLPISSTGHMILLARYLSIEKTDTLMLFEIVVQFGAILAVLLYYHHRLLSLELWKRLAVGFIPTGIAGVLVYPHLKDFLQNELLVGCMLLLGGIIIIAVERYVGENGQGYTPAAELSYLTVFLLGCAQIFAMVPGVSRSGAIIVAGLVLGLARYTIIEYAFLLAVPTMFIASLYTLHKKQYLLSIPDVWGPLLTGTLAACIVAFFVIHFVLGLIKRIPFSVFGWYRIALGLVVIFILW